LRAVLARLSSGEIARTLERLSADDAALLWRLVDENKRDDILWEISTD